MEEKNGFNRRTRQGKQWRYCIVKAFVVARILIDAMHGIPNAIMFLDEQRASGIQISVISAMELVAGCRDKSEFPPTDLILQILKSCKS